jgi:hypothetical protein
MDDGFKVNTLFLIKINGFEITHVENLTKVLFNKFNLNFIINYKVQNLYTENLKFPLLNQCPALKLILRIKIENKAPYYPRYREWEKGGKGKYLLLNLI